MTTQEKIEAIENIIRRCHLQGSVDFHLMAVQIAELFSEENSVLSPSPGIDLNFIEADTCIFFVMSQKRHNDVFVLLLKT